jgi:hypothetical protein
MITEKDLAVVRAALQFLDEEMSPSGNEKTLNHYLDDRGKQLGVTTADIKSTREKIETSNLFYARKALGLNELDSVALVPASTEGELSYLSDRIELVSVLAIKK